MAAANEEQIEMIDYALDMLAAELPLIELEYGWTPQLQSDIRERLEALRTAAEAGGPMPSSQLAADLDAAGVKEGTLREFCEMLESTLGA